MDHAAIVGVIIREIRQIIPELASQSIGPADAMADLGLTSMERGEVIIAAQEAMDLDIPMVQLFGPRNIGELADLLHARQAV
ncbi:MAG: phosphopantetheine-binding protein [Pseudomonadota bacterium]